MQTYFYNTIGLSGKMLADAHKSNAKQEDIILHFINSNKGTFSAWEIQDTPQFHHIPITSIRRALHNLVSRSLIMEAGFKPGPYGKPVTMYRSKEKQLSMFE